MTAVDDPSAMAAAERPRRAQAVRRLLPALLILGLAALLAERLGSVSAEAVLSALGALTPVQVAGAAALTAASLAAAALYDRLAAAYLGLPLTARQTLPAGFAAVSIAQLTGFGVVVGSLVRLRMLPTVGPDRALLVTPAATGLFLFGWATVSVLALALSGGEGLAGRTLLALLGVPVLAVLVAGVIPVEVRVRQGGFRLPSLRVLCAAAALAALDLVPAAASLWILLPEEAPGFAAFLPVFLVATVAGMVSSAPSGIVAFDVIVLAALAGAPAEPVLAALVAWRAVYHLMPALAGLAVLIRGPAPDAVRALARRVPWVEPGSHDDLRLFHAPRAEAGLLRQGGKYLIEDRISGVAAVADRTHNTLVQIGDPVAGAPGDALSALVAAARARGTWPAVYKGGDAMARAARSAGWAVRPVAIEAWIEPAAFSAGAPGLGRLRRKLRKAYDAGLVVRRGTEDLPDGAHAAIAEDWAEARGGERGFSMGRYAPDYVARQDVFTAFAGGRAVGFATFHAGAGERTLDLIRVARDAPDGTAHALVYAAIAAARDEGCPRLSLAALPHPAAGGLLRRLPLWPCAEGLAQFKQAFGPDWETLHAAAPNRVLLVLALAEIAQRVLRPGPLPSVEFEEVEEPAESGTDAPPQARPPALPGRPRETPPARGTRPAVSAPPGPG